MKTTGLPNGFEVLTVTDNKEVNVDNAFNDLKRLMTTMDWSSNVAKKMENDIRMLLEAGWYAYSSEMIPVEKIVKGKTFFITNNMALVKRMLKTQLKRQYFEDAVNMHGLEHFIDVRQCDNLGNVTDYFA